MLLHGIGGSSLELDGLTRTLRGHGFHVVTPVLPGYSAPEIEPAPEYTRPSFRRWVADAAAEVERLAATHDEVNVCGVSSGATLALAVAAERPTQLDALSLISTTLFFDGWNTSRWRFLLPLVYYTPLGQLYRYRQTPPYGVKNKHVQAWIAGKLERSGRFAVEGHSISTESLREADRLSRHVCASLGRVRTPTLMIHAREDDVASLANVRFVRKHIAADMFSEIIVEDSYHMITLDNDRDFAALKTVQFFHAASKKRADAALAISLSAQQLERRSRNIVRSRAS
jgi:carboxylesterase